MKTSLLRSARRASLLHSQRGLTLVEIMVVIAILGALMAVVGVNVVGRLQDANVETTKLQIKQIEQNLAMYAAKNKGRFPTTSQGLEAAARYFPDSTVPTDAWGNPFQYFSPGTSSESPYEIISYGRDGAEGGEGHDADIKSWMIGKEE